MWPRECWRGTASLVVVLKSDFFTTTKGELNHKSLHSNLCPLMFGWGTSRGTRALSDCRWRCLLLHATVVLHVGQGLWGDLNYINHDLLKGHIKTLNGHQLMSDWQLVLNLSVCYPIRHHPLRSLLFFFLRESMAFGFVHSLSARSKCCERQVRFKAQAAFAVRSRWTKGL